MNFYLHPHVYLITGALKGALYNLQDGGIFSISPTLKQILILTEKGTPIENFPKQDVITDSLNKLTNLKLGYFTETVRPPQKIQIESPKPRLGIMWLALNSNCNLVCEHCYASSEPGPFDGTLDFKYLFNAMHEAREIFNVQCIQLIGGEPLLLGKKKVTEIIKKAYDLGTPIIEVFTNGHLIDNYYIDLFKNNKVHVAISIYSNTAVEHDAVTNRKGSWQKTVNAIRLVSDNKIPLRFGITAMEQNKKTVAETAPWLKSEFGIDNGEKLYDVVRSCGRGSNDEIIPWDLFMQNHMRLKPDFSPVSVSSLQRTMFGNICWAEEICIMPNGDVTPCEMEFENVQGNITQQSLKEIILGKGGEYAQRLTKDKIEICKDCEYRYACWECRAMAHQLDTKKFSKPLTCMYNPYEGIWENPPEKLSSRFPGLEKKAKIQSS